MLKNEGLISRLSTEQKVKLLVLKDTKQRYGTYSLDDEKINQALSNISNVVLYKKNQKSITFDVIKTFVTILFSELDKINVEEETSVNVIKTDDFEEMIAALNNNTLLVLTTNTKIIEKQFNERINKVSDFEVDLTQIEFNNASDSNEIITIDMLNILVDKMLEKIIPLIEKIENPNLTKRDPELQRDIFSPRLKRLMIEFCMLYYNGVMFFVYRTKLDGDTIKYALIAAWVLINLICIVLLLRCRTKKVVKDVDNTVEEISTTDFEIVLAEEKIVKVSNVSFNEISIKELCESFYSFLLENGMMLEHKKIRELFSAMASTRLVVLNNRSDNDIEFLALLNKFFGNETFYTQVKDYSETESDVFFEDDKVVDFIKGICRANDNTSNVNIASLTNVDLNKAHLYLNSIANFAKNPNEKGSIILDKEDFSIDEYVKNKRLSIPKNMWFILFNKEGSNSVINSNLVNEAIVLDIDVSNVTPKENLLSHKILSSVNFLDGINIAREEQYLTNDSWDKIDEIEKQLKEKYNFSIENRIVRKLEVYASVYKVCSEDEKTTLDSTIANVILPVIFYGQENIYSAVLDILKDVLEDENIVLTKEILNKYK